MHSNHISLSAFITELKQLSHKHMSGALLFTTDQNQMGQFNFSNGEIVYLSILNMRGLDALPFIRQAKTFSFHFWKGKLSNAEVLLPPTEELFDLLIENNKDEVSTEITSETTKTNEDVTDKGITEETKIILQEMLTEIIGPVASMVCKKHLKKSNDLRSVLITLTKEISDAKEAKQFKLAVQQEFGINF